MQIHTYIQTTKIFCKYYTNCLMEIINKWKNGIWIYKIYLMNTEETLIACRVKCEHPNVKC